MDNWDTFNSTITAYRNGIITRDMFCGIWAMLQKMNSIDEALNEARKNCGEF